MATLARRLQKEGLPLGTLLRSAVAGKGKCSCWLTKVSLYVSRSGHCLVQIRRGMPTDLTLSAADVGAALPEAEEQRTADIKYRVLMDAPSDSREVSCVDMPLPVFRTGTA